MDPKHVLDVVERILIFWEKKLGVILAVGAVGWLYIEVTNVNININNWKDPVSLGAVGGLIGISVALVLWWRINTSRTVVIRKSFTLGLLILVDDDVVEHKMKKIVRQCVRGINADFEKIRVAVLPINFVENVKGAQDYYQKSPYDAIICAVVKSGRQRTENGADEKIEVKQLYFFGRHSKPTELFDVYGNKRIVDASSVLIYHQVVNIDFDLKVGFSDKDWEYIEDNSFIDKDKIQGNLREVILHYIGIYLIYLNDFELSLEVLKNLLDSNEMTSQEKAGKLAMTDRLKEIVVDLFGRIAINSYDKDLNKEKAYRILKESEARFESHKDFARQYMTLAKISYELGYIHEAKAYTAKLRERRGDKLEVLFNEAFFCILDNDIEGFVKTYEKIITSDPQDNLDYYELLDFLDIQKNKLNRNAEMFEFSVAAINMWFIDRKTGSEQLRLFVKQNSDCEELVKLADSMFAYSLRVRSQQRSKKNQVKSNKKKR